MTGEILHELDKDLCGYLHFNIRMHAGITPFWEKLKRRLCHDLTPLMDYLENADLWQSGNNLLLGDSDFQELRTAVEAWDRHYTLAWSPIEAVHARRPSCTKEIHDALSLRDANEWANAAATCAQKLEENGLLLADGIDCIDQWVSLNRRFLAAMRSFDYLPMPIGTIRTPRCTTHDAQATKPLDALKQKALTRMRERLGKHGRDAKSETLITQCGVNRRDALWALGYLKKTGEYTGHMRQRED